MELIKLVTFKLLLFSILIFTLSCSISSCGDDIAEPFSALPDTTGTTIIPFDTMLANYANVNMGRGSIFIYETVDGLRDTTIVKHSQEVYNVYQDKNISYQGYEQLFDCSVTATYQVHLTIWESRDSSLWFEHELYAPAGGGHDFYLENGIFKPENEVIIVDSVVVNNITFKDVLMSKRGGSFYSEIWYAKNIGIIMKKAWIENNPTAEFYLVDYEIK